MGKGGKKKNWPRSWKQAAAVGGTLVLKGRSVEVEYAVLPLRGEAETPTELEAKIQDAIIEAAKARSS